MCTDDVSEAVTLEERDESLAAEEVCRATPRVVDEALVLLQVLDGFWRQHLQADTTKHVSQNQLFLFGPGDTTKYVSQNQLFSYSPGDTTKHVPQNQLSSYHPGLAQWLEHWTGNLRVRGSSPTGEQHLFFTIID